MFVIIGIMISGVVLGYLLRNRPQKSIHKVITILIWVLLFILGVEVGVNSEIVNNLHTLGIDALIISTFSVLGSIIGAKMLWQWVKKSNH